MFFSLARALSLDFFFFRATTNAEGPCGESLKELRECCALAAVDKVILLRARTILHPLLKPDGSG